MRFTDSHCHLSFPELASQTEAVLARMADAGVGRALCICTTLEEFPQVLALAQSRPLQEASAWLQPILYAFLGLIWIVPLLPLISWMAREDR